MYGKRIWIDWTRIWKEYIEECQFIFLIFTQTDSETDRQMDKDRTRENWL